MTINDTYGKYEIVFSRSASDLRVSDAGTSAVPVSVMVDTEEVAAFSVMPYNKEIVLNLSGILESCAADNLPGLSSTYIVRNIKITVGGQKWEHLVLFGVKPAKLSVDKYDILTRRPARVMTFRDSVEYVSLKWEFYSAQGTGSELLAEVYFMTHPPVKVTLPGPVLLTSHTGMARIDCSFAVVSAAAASAGYGDEVILGWKVWARDVKLSTSGPAVETLGAPQEFYLLPSRRHCSYLFRNCYGFFDTIHATGPKSLSSDGEVSTSSMVGWRVSLIIRQGYTLSRVPVTLQLRTRLLFGWTLCAARNDTLLRMALPRRLSLTKAMRRQRLRNCLPLSLSGITLTETTITIYEETTLQK